MELLISNKRTGQIWDVANCTQSAEWTTNRTGSPGLFRFTLNANGGVSFVEGDAVRFSVDGQAVFYGWVFTKSKDRWGVIDVTCYDRLRYLKTNASYAWYGATVGEIIQEIAENLQIGVSSLVDTGYKIPSLIETDQSCFDIIEGALQKTLLNTGKIYVLYDDGTGLAMQDSGQMIYPAIIGEKSMLLDYTYKTDIDEQTYNSIKLVRPNEETGRADTFIAQDSDTIAQWGLLQLYQTVDGAVNDAMVREQAETSLQFYNRRMRTLKCSSLGLPGLRAGQMLRMWIPGMGDINLDQYVLLERVSHHWENDLHTMEFDTMAL